MKRSPSGAFYVLVFFLGVIFHEQILGLFT